MTTLLRDDDRRATRMKPKSGNQKVSIDGTGTNGVRDESRSFLNFSRENLSISQSELEQGFNKRSRCFRPSRHSILSLVAILVALVCAGIEIWKLHKVISNTRDIEMIKRDVETFRHRLFGEDFMDELRAFEEQLYADSSDADEDSGEADIEGADYDNNYDEEYNPSWDDYVSDSSEPTIVTPRSDVGQDSQSSLKEKQSKNGTPSTLNRERIEMLAVLHKVEAQRGQKLEKNVQEFRNNISKEHSLEKTPGSSSGPEKRIFEKQQSKIKEDHPKRRRAVTEPTPIQYTAIGEGIHGNLYSRNDHNRTKPGNVFQNGSDDPRTVRKKKKNNKSSTTEAETWDRHPPKKYFAVTGVDGSNDFPLSHRAPRLHSVSLDLGKDFGEADQVSELRRIPKSRVIKRRHLRAPRQIFAAHYAADSTLFTTEDEHTGNGRAKHNEGVFKAWRPSEWVTDLGMSRYFTLSRDGKLAVHEPGLYLVYGQIHYLDEHDENGFHILVNGHPILQCMVYSPGTGHKSRSCFSAQITVLRAGDRLVLKDVGPARYTLFQHDKSFFGLVKLGDSRQPQQQSKHTTQIPETLR